MSFCLCLPIISNEKMVIIFWIANFLSFNLAKSNFWSVAICPNKRDLDYFFRMEEVHDKPYSSSSKNSFAEFTEKRFCLASCEQNGRKHETFLYWRCMYFLHSEKIIQMPLNWANCNQSKIWFCQIKIQEICNPTYFYQFFMSGWLPAIKWHWKKVAWPKLDKVSKNMAIIYSKWKLFCQKGIKLTPF